MVDDRDKPALPSVAFCAVFQVLVGYIYDVFWPRLPAVDILCTPTGQIRLISITCLIQVYTCTLERFGAGLIKVAVA